jgi:hypothetical protein
VSVAQFAAYLITRPNLIEDARRELAGHDLACWCPAELACHAERSQLIAIATGPDFLEALHAVQTELLSSGDIACQRRVRPGPLHPRRRRAVLPLALPRGAIIDRYARSGR